MNREYDWEELLLPIKSFARVENIKEIIILGDNDGVRRVILEDE